MDGTSSLQMTSPFLLSIAGPGLYVDTISFQSISSYQNNFRIKKKNIQILNNQCFGHTAELLLGVLAELGLADWQCLCVCKLQRCCEQIGPKGIHGLILQSWFFTINCNLYLNSKISKWFMNSGILT
jgi:hypothetical protein